MGSSLRRTGWPIPNLANDSVLSMVWSSMPGLLRVVVEEITK